MKLAKVAQNFTEYCGEVYTVRGQFFMPKLAEIFSKNPLTNSRLRGIMTVQENTAKVQMKRGEHNGEQGKSRQYTAFYHAHKEAAHQNQGGCRGARAFNLGLSISRGS